MKIYLISASLSPGGITCKTDEKEVSEKPVCYMANGLRVMKSNLLVVDTIWREQLGSIINYTTYCLEPDIEKAKVILIKKIKSQVALYSKQLNQLVSELEKGVTSDTAI